ncbi:Crp/Fnr family transcriptional regulator [Aquimarina sp. TRL1]|uniref:Crp/Fnr family transcriptional regulator n=1 Tax=Aquimarina sp. (strain TRL1) TaxID=2736252 RepID=UPI00158C6F78|nr:Crp/Fnr family transcriptional regulator [Aquimarina sp. TRL1]QKX03897.1 Crp/Fnr family transcriptional regulator [Aquimarina sp. TRL1]
MFDLFIQLINQYTLLNQKEIDLLKDTVSIRSYKKNEILFAEGKVATSMYFVLQGWVRLFYNVNGNDKTAFFYTEGKFICAGESFAKQVPARENYQVLEDTVLVHFEKENIEKLLQYSSKFELISRLATEDELITYQKIVASFVTQSPEQRYRDLLNKNGVIFHKVPQQYIASFLGVSPETLSRIKKRVLTKEH